MAFICRDVSPKNPESHGGKDAAAVAFIQVCSHSGDVAHVVSHIVGDCGRVARIILRDVCFHLPHDVSSHVGAFGIDSTAHTGEQGLRAGSHSEGEHGGGDHDQVVAVGRIVHSIEDKPPYGYVQKPQADDGETHDGSAPERDPESSVEGFPDGVGSPGGCISRSPHSDESRKAGEESSRQESERHPGILKIESVGHYCEDNRKDDENDGDDLILLLEIGHRSFPHVLCDFFHRRGSLIFFPHLAVEKPGKEKGQDRCGRDKIEQFIHVFRLN